MGTTRYLQKPTKNSIGMKGPLPSLVTIYVLSSSKQKHRWPSKQSISNYNNPTWGSTEKGKSLGPTEKVVYIISYCGVFVLHEISCRELALRTIVSSGKHKLLRWFLPHRKCPQHKHSPQNKSNILQNTVFLMVRHQFCLERLGQHRTLVGLRSRYQSRLWWYLW